VTDTGSARDPSRIWSTDPALELSHYTARRAFPLHFHAEGIVSVVVSGAARVCVDGRSEMADEGSIVVLEPERAHLYQPVGAGGTRYRGFYVNAALLQGTLAGRRLASNVMRNGRLSWDLIELHRSLEERPAPAVVAAAKQLVARVFDDALLACAECVPPEEVQRVARDLRERCAERLSWNDLARSVGVSAAHLARRFRSHFGVPPHLYQVQYRIARAKRLIQRRLGLATTALDCGFSDQSHFTHQFTRYVGQTPGAFLRAQDSTRP